MPAPLAVGTFLIASPHLDHLGDYDSGDPHFNRTVVLLLQHQPDEGTVGVVINRPLGEKIKLYTSEALQQLTEGLQIIRGNPIEPASMFFQGGPVQRSALIFLHQLDGLIEDGTEICDGVFAGGDLEAVGAHATVANAEKPILRFYLGFASWEVGQLENEIAQRDSWILCPGSADLIFSTEPEMIWQRALYSLGDKYRSMSFIPEGLQKN
jgi:putative transcriptional regulator